MPSFVYTVFQQFMAMQYNLYCGIITVDLDDNSLIVAIQKPGGYFYWRKADRVLRDGIWLTWDDVAEQLNGCYIRAFTLIDRAGMQHRCIEVVSKDVAVNPVAEHAAAVAEQSHFEKLARKQAAILAAHARKDAAIARKEAAIDAARALEDAAMNAEAVSIQKRILEQMLDNNGVQGNTFAAQIKRFLKQAVISDKDRALFERLANGEDLSATHFEILILSAENSFAPAVPVSAAGGDAPSSNAPRNASFLMPPAMY